MKWDAVCPNFKTKSHFSNTSMIFKCWNQGNAWKTRHKSHHKTQIRVFQAHNSLPQSIDPNNVLNSVSILFLNIPMSCKKSMLIDYLKHRLKFCVKKALYYFYTTNQLMLFPFSFPFQIMSSMVENFAATI